MGAGCVTEQEDGLHRRDLAGTGKRFIRREFTTSGLGLKVSTALLRPATRGCTVWTAHRMGISLGAEVEEGS
jgi:hypothetical protein